MHINANPLFSMAAEAGSTLQKKTGGGILIFSKSRGERLCLIPPAGALSPPRLKILSAS